MNENEADSSDSERSLPAVEGPEFAWRVLLGGRGWVGRGVVVVESRPVILRRKERSEAKSSEPLSATRRLEGRSLAIGSSSRWTDRDQRGAERNSGNEEASVCGWLVKGERPEQGLRRRGTSWRSLCGGSGRFPRQGRGSNDCNYREWSL